MAKKTGRAKPTSTKADVTKTHRRYGSGGKVKK